MRYIYALVDPRKPEEIRYVGQTSSVIRRKLQHERKMSAREIWISELQAQGLQPALLVLETVIGEDNANAREQHYIEKHNSPLLLNVAYSPARTLKECELARIREALHQTHGNKSEAAKLLGISRPTLYEKLGELEQNRMKYATEAVTL